MGDRATLINFPAHPLPLQALTWTKSVFRVSSSFLGSMLAYDMQSGLYLRTGGFKEQRGGLVTR